MTNSTNDIMNELNKEDTCLCIGKNSCGIKYIYKPVVKYIITPPIKYIIKPFFRKLKSGIIKCSMCCESCSFGCVGLPRGSN